MAHLKRQPYRGRNNARFKDFWPLGDRVIGGGQKKVTSQAFQGGEILVAFCGMEMGLRGVTLVEGGVDDKRSQPNASEILSPANLASPDRLFAGD